MYDDNKYDDSYYMKELFEDWDGHDDDSMGDWADTLTEDIRLMELKNEKRDKRGRLAKGSRIAAKINCDKDLIRNHYRMGLSVKEIAEKLECSKTTVYNAIKGMDKINRPDMDMESPFR